MKRLSIIGDCPLNPARVAVLTSASRPRLLENRDHGYVVASADRALELSAYANRDCTNSAWRLNPVSP